MLDSKQTTLCSGSGEEEAHALESTARKPKVRLDTMAEVNPNQLKVSSEADASATPNCREHLHNQLYIIFRSMSVKVKDA